MIIRIINKKTSLLHSVLWLVGALLTSLAAPLAKCDTGTLYSNATDAQVNSTGTITNSTATFANIGGVNGTQGGVVYAFQIPSSYLTDPTQQFTTANLTIKFGSAPSGMTINGDLYGLGTGLTPTVLPTDYYEGALDPANLLIQDNFVTPSTPSYTAVSNTSGTLVSYLNGCLASARLYQISPAYVFFRVSPDGYVYWTTYVPGMSEATGGYAPTLSYTTAVAPGWNSVPLGGGGYVTGLVSNADGSAIYARTDVGGAFKWVPALDGTNGSWTSISDSLVAYNTSGAAGLMNTEGIGTDPNNLGQVYIAVGSNSSTGLRGIFSSSNQGATWTQINSTIRMNGNGSYRSDGERLAVDPNDSNTVWYGSNQDGLQKGVNSGGTWTWTPISSSLVPFGLAGAGITNVVCDKNAGSTIVYASVYDSSVGGIYKSTDGGTTWTKMSGSSLLTPNRAQIASNGNLYVTAGSAGLGKLTRGGTFTMNSTLPTGISYHSVAVDPNDATGNTVYVAQGSSASNTNILRSNDGGATWHAQGTTFNEGPITQFNHARKEPDGTPCLTGYWFGSNASMMINPANSNELWESDFFGVSRTRNASAMGTNPGCWWYTLQKNQEETVVLDMKSTPTGPKLLTGLSDVGGFNYKDITLRPTGAGGNGMGNPGGGNFTSIDFSEANNNVCARAWVSPNGSPGPGSGAWSTDGGVTWQKFGEIAQSTITNSASAGWQTWDLTTFLAQQQAKGVTNLTLVVATNNTPDYSTNTLTFDSKESANPPGLVINGGTPIAPTADAMVEGANPATNYGSATILQCQYAYGTTANSRWIYLQFNLSGAPTITSATLQLHRQSSTNSTVFPTGVYACTNTTWTEGTLTWNNKPSALSNSGGGPQEGPNYYDGSTALAGGRVAVSSTDPHLMVWMPINAAPRYSNDGGATWTVSSGAPASQITGIYTNGTSVGTTGQPLAADRGNGNFYIVSFGGATDTIYRSTDGGKTWASAGTVNNGGSYNGRTPQLMAAPVSTAFPTGGDVWLCDDGTYNNSGGGLWRSTNSGSSWSSVSSATKVTSVSFGKASSGSGYSVFINGFVGGVQGIYRSDDYGSTWTHLSNPTLEANTAIVTGDRQNYGRVFIGTGGRGIFQGQK